MDINTAVYKLSITSSFTNFSINFDSFAGTVPKAPIVIGTITVFALNCSLTSAAKSMYLSIFFLFLFFNMMIHWDGKIHNVPRFPFPINHYHIWYDLSYDSLSYQSLLVCSSRLLLSHHLLLL